MRDSYIIVEKKVKQFIRKYYLNKLIQGSILFLIVSLLLVGILIALEGNYYLDANKKIGLIFTYIILQLGAFFFYIIVPSLGFLGIINIVTKKHINEILVRHFPEIQDKFWNIIELHAEKQTENIYSKELIQASIDQKINSLKIFNFQEAISLRSNIKFLYFLTGIIVLAAIIIGIMPNTVKNSSSRLIHFTTNFEKPSPYRFNVLNDSLVLGKGETFILEIAVESNEEINSLNIYFGGNTYIMNNDSANVFSFKFNNLNNSLGFKLGVDKYVSKEYYLRVLEKPLLLGYSVEIKKPVYTNQANQVFDNLSELILPVGSTGKFVFKCFETDTLMIKDFIGNIDYIAKTSSNTFEFNKKFFDKEKLLIGLINSYYKQNELLEINVDVIKDEYPDIKVIRMIDSLDFTRVYFKGTISDDYGFKKLMFVTKVKERQDSAIILPIINSLMQQDFYFAFDFLSYKGSEKSIQYYFDVSDNDDISGFKHAISEVFTFSFPDEKEILKYQDEEFAKLDDLLKSSKEVTKNIQEDLFKLQEKLINSELTDWEKKEALKNIVSLKEQLENKLQDISKRNKDLNSYMQSFTEQEKEIFEKQKLIEDLLQNVLTDELKKLLDEFQKMMNEFNENKLGEQREKLDISLEDLSKQLDRNIEMLKKSQIESKLNQVKSSLEEIIHKHKEDITRLEEKNDLLGTKKNQTELKNSIDDLKKEYNEILKLNNELDKPLNLFNFDNEIEDIKKEFDSTNNELNNNKKKRASDSMKKNKDDMDQLSFMLNQMMENAFAEQNAENLADMMQILDNLLIFSFNQEDLLKVKQNDLFSPAMSKMQKEVTSNFTVIKDSLYALSKREPSINSIVNKEIVSILSNFNAIEGHLKEGRNGMITTNQQLIMTSANNLALFLSEAIKNMQQQMASKSNGNQNCNKPGNKPSSNSSSSNMKQMQQGLQQQLENLMQMMKEGKDGKGINGELGKALSQQEMLQNKLRELMNSGGVGSNARETLKAADELLNKVKDDILRKNITNETLTRQRQIMTRLLEAEKSENERDIDEKRKSETADKVYISETAKYFDKTNSNDKFEERLLKERLLLNSFYQKKFQNYINKVDSLNAKTN